MLPVATSTRRLEHAPVRHSQSRATRRLSNAGLIRCILPRTGPGAGSHEQHRLSHNSLPFAWVRRAESLKRVERLEAFPGPQLGLAYLAQLKDFAL